MKIMQKQEQLKLEMSQNLEEGKNEETIKDLIANLKESDKTLRQMNQLINDKKVTQQLSEMEKQIDRLG